MDIDHFIPYTRYVLPNGRKVHETLLVSAETFEKARELIESGLEFEAEILTTGQVSFTIVDPVEEIDVDILVAANDENLIGKIESLIQNFKREETTDEED